MGQAPRLKPQRLAQKLLQIRTSLNLSQSELIQHLKVSDTISQNNISAFERGTREPSLPILLRYARAANVWMDVLVDDEVDLPAELPCAFKQEGIQRKKAKKSHSTQAKK